MKYSMKESVYGSTRNDVMLQEEFNLKFKNKRFQIKEHSLHTSPGSHFSVVDTIGEMIPIRFDSDWTEAEEFCIFINNLYEKTL